MSLYGSIGDWAVLSIGPSGQPLTDPFEILELGRGVFALVLFSVSLYAWYKRRQPALIIVSLAFLPFFVKSALDLLPLSSPANEFTRLSMDFIALALFFIAIVLRPRKDDSSETVVKQPLDT
ncbi:hypothetical protein AUG19_07650 [archaeon 13_1_20CM_2_54_9]|nr:MAG: hypothetical protein AUJ07_09985 [Crenarchaeota archaeon 13_1_40CM_3_53_5]OLE74793.1 MAG: hypothetical protein AUG19_07650 [archaeon 13_1_20CM_2_54_9]TMI31763.1 MAG: hypothetical protein E6H29_03360 [Candidatus Bathyarchaeota archaeon]